MKKFNITVNGTAYKVEVEEDKEVKTTAPAAKAAPVAPPKVAAPAVSAAAPAQVGAGDTAVKSPMPGKIINVVTKAGQAVKKGDVLMILEAMKMQNEIVAPIDGVVKSVNAAAQQSVKTNEILVVIK